jgi:hypothetical protein
MVGMSGAKGLRLALATASARALPARIWGNAVTRISNMQVTLA